MKKVFAFIVLSTLLTFAVVALAQATVLQQPGEAPSSSAVEVPLSLSTV